MSRIDQFRDHLYRRLRWEEIDPAWVRERIVQARDEDLEGAGLRTVPLRPGDRSTGVVAGSRSMEASLTARTAITVCGLPIVPPALEVYGGGVSWTPAVKDGTAVPAGSLLGRLAGPVEVLLPAERILLNFLQHLSGIATLTAAHAAALGWSKTRLLDTRKTTPGFRVLEKYAVACGGGWNHRMGLFDRVMLKDNHLAAGGAGAGERLGAAVRRALELHGDCVVEVEVDRMDQIPPVLDAGADVILVDNFPLPDLAEAVSLINGRALSEASGGVTLDTLPEIGKIGPDFVSCGAVTHQSRWVDIGLDAD